MSLQDSFEDKELQKRLELFQAFSKLYERHPDLLHEILALDQTGTKPPGQLGLSNYVQGVVVNQQVFLVTNLLASQSQLLVQPQHIWLIGRDSGQVSLPIRDKRLSRRHAAIQYRASEGFFINDMGSTNGTFVNGERIRHLMPLCDGDRVRLGSMAFSFFVCSMGHSLPPVDVEVVSHLNQAALQSTLSDQERCSGHSEITEDAEIPAVVLEETLHFIRRQTGHN